MIRYYAYYSCGGYKDLYLGNSSLKTEYTYFLPLLATWQKGAKPEYAEKLRRIEGLQQIEVISKDNYFDFPTQAKNLFSHGGYRVIYLTHSNGDTCLCVRDITNGAKDEEDRDIPFNILITATGKDDIRILDQFSLNSLSHINGLYELMAPLFSYDPQVNGIKFNLGKLDQAIYDVPLSDRELEHKVGYVNFLIVDSVSMSSTALNELNLKREQIDYMAFNDGKFFGSLNYKALSTPDEMTNTSCQLTKYDEMVPVYNQEKDLIIEESSEHKEITSEDFVQSQGSELLHDEDSHKSKSTGGIQTGKEELISQYSNIQNVLKDLLGSIKNISADLDNSKSISSLEVQKILDRIDSLKENNSNPRPIIPAPVKDDNSINISKIHLWIAGGALIVGFLLGSLIF